MPLSVEMRFWQQKFVIGVTDARQLAYVPLYKARGTNGRVLQREPGLFFVVWGIFSPNFG